MVAICMAISTLAWLAYGLTFYRCLSNAYTSTVKRVVYVEKMQEKYMYRRKEFMDYMPSLVGFNGLEWHG